ncbi:MAG: phage terminase large subunit [Brevinema sp.]
MALSKEQFIRKMAGLSAKMQAVGSSTGSSPSYDSQSGFWNFVHRYLPHYFTEDSPRFHKEIIDLLEQEKPCTAIAAPRGFAKSTLVSLAYSLWKIISGDRKFLVIVSATDKLAADLVEFIKIELETNSLLIKDFGHYLVHSSKKGDFTTRDTRILALGKKRALRGFRSRQHRPDLIILDDIEKDAEAYSPEMVQQTLDLILRGLLPSLDPQRGRLIFIGTILRERSAAGIILKSSEEPFCKWVRAIYKSINTLENGSEQSLWEQRFPLTKLKDIRASMGIDAFQTEYQNSPRQDNSQIFKPELFIENSLNENTPVGVFIDPATDKLTKNDFKAAVFVSKQDNQFEILDAVLVQGRDVEFFARFTETFRRYQHRIIAVGGEGNGFQQYFLKDLQQFLKDSGITLSIKVCKSSTNKELRIARLAQYFESKRLFFSRGALNSAWGKILIEQLEYFPQSHVHDDAPDALAGVIELLEGLSKPSDFIALPKRAKKSF